MLRNALIAGLLAATAISAPAYAAAPAPAAAPAAAHYTTAETDIGTLLDDPASKAVLDKNMPGFSSNPQIDMARAMTLAQIQQFAPDQVSANVLAKIDADLAKLPPKK
jgi:para-nitrobenzyl esterase